MAFSGKIGLKKRIGLNLFRMYRKNLALLHDLEFLFWECTLRCNLQCRHCGSDCTLDTQTKDMPLRDFVRVLEEVKTVYNPGNVMLGLTGGEPLLRPDLEQCGQAFKRLGYPWGIVTNGLILTETRLLALLAAGLSSLTISLDGLADSHNWLRGDARSFTQAVQAIRLVAARGPALFDVVTCVHRDNLSELAAIKDLLVDIGVKRWRIFNIFPKGRAAGNDTFLLSGSQFRALLEFIRTTRQQGRIAVNYACEGFLGAYENLARDDYFFCRAGITVASVLADGSISACPSLRGDYIQGSIYRDSFLAVWKGKYDVMRNRGWTRTGVCRDCKVYKWCAGNGLHLRDQQTGELLKCHYRLLTSL